MTDLMLRRSLMMAGDGGVMLADLPVGTGIFLEEGGVLTEYDIVSGNYLTAEGVATGRVLLLRRGVYGTKAIGGTSYKNSEMDLWLNSDFFALLAAGVQQQIEEVAVRCCASSSGAIIAIDRKVFLLSYTEVGGTGSSFPAMGCALPYFASNEDRIAYNSEGEAATWWLRSQRLTATSFAIISSSGTLNGYGLNTVLRGVRPAFTLPQKARAVPDAQGRYLLAV